MKPTSLTLAIALALGALSGCDSKPEPTAAPTAPAGSGATTPTAPNTPVPGEKGRSETPPVQGQVDTRESEQQTDFKRRGN